MSEPSGNCLSCGATVRDQSHCDSCSEDKTYECKDCGGDGFEREYLNCYEHEMDELRDTITFLKKGWEIKDARIHDLETRLADMTRLVELGIKLDEMRREEK